MKKHTVFLDEKENSVLYWFVSLMPSNPHLRKGEFLVVVT